jgi:hypothetical protein
MVGLRAPARRVGFFLENASGLQLSGNGQALFDAAVAWAAGSIAPKALFVAGNASLSAADQAVYDKMAGNGIAVTRFLHGGFGGRGNEVHQRRGSRPELGTAALG